MADRVSLRPMCETELSEIFAEAAASRKRLALAGNGSKRAIGREVDGQTVDLTGIVGVVDYDPSELVLTVRPGTLLKDVEALLAAQDQMLAFDPFDHGPVFGEPAGGATIGGVVGAGVAGSRRFSAGGVRDHLLGFRAVSGRGEPFVGGAKVVKNVTGYDLPKVACGSWGRLFAMTELTLKVSPKPRVRRTIYLEDLDPREAVAAMAAAAGSRAEIAAAAHVPAAPSRAGSLTALRIEGFGPSVEARGDMLKRLLLPVGKVAILDDGEADLFWSSLAGGAQLPRTTALWRVHVPPSSGSAIADAAAGYGASWSFDWAGGLVWVAGACEPGPFRRLASDLGGHAMLVRDTPEMRAAVPALHPLSTGLAALEERVRRAFDPGGIFETGRF